MKKITKEQIYVSSIFLIIVASIILFLFPEVIKYPYSYTNISEKKALVEVENSRLIQNESAIQGLTKNYEDKKTQENMINNDAVDLKRNVNEKDFVLNIPSILISLEQESYKNNLNLSIYYNQIKTIDDSETPIVPETPTAPETSEKTDSETDSTESKEDLEKTEENIDSKDKTEEEKTIGGESVDKENKDDGNETEEEKESFSNEDIEKGTLKVDGLNVTVIPVTIEGSYNSVRSYIKYLDEIGMIEPSSVEIISEEKKITAKIILNVFHGEVL